MKHYHIWASGFAYCVDEYASSKKKAIEQFKKRWELKRMPAGSLIREAQAFLWEGTGIIAMRSFWFQPVTLQTQSIKV